MSLPFNIRADLTLSYFVILFFNYLQGLHVLPSSIHFVIFKNSFLLNHEDPCDVPHTTGNNMMYTIHSWVLYACALSFMSKYLYQSCGRKLMTRVNINDNNQSSNRNDLFYRHLESKTLSIFGETLCMRWNFQNSNLKKELMDYLEGLFGVDTFNKKVVTSAVGEYLKYTRDVYR
jgi:hypothetical protein